MECLSHLDLAQTLPTVQEIKKLAHAAAEDD